MIFTLSFISYDTNAIISALCLVTISKLVFSTALFSGEILFCLFLENRWLDFSNIVSESVSYRWVQPIRIRGAY